MSLKRFTYFLAWGGQPNSPGHYLDLVIAILGCTLLPLGLLGALIQRKDSN